MSGEISKLLSYIMIDEYQDTNYIQYLWARLLALKHSNLFVVGDPINLFIVGEERSRIILHASSMIFRTPGL